MRRRAQCPHPPSPLSPPTHTNSLPIALLTITLWPLHTKLSPVRLKATSNSLADACCISCATELQGVPGGGDASAPAAASPVTPAAAPPATPPAAAPPAGAASATGVISLAAEAGAASSLLLVLWAL